MKEKEEDEERNENICLHTHNQAENSKTEAHSNPLWSVDRRGAGQLCTVTFYFQLIFFSIFGTKIKYFVPPDEI